MNKLSFTIKPNDELTLKSNLQDYVLKDNIVGLRNCRIRFKPNRACKDPKFFIHYDNIINWNSKKVVVTYTSIKHRITKDNTYHDSFYYITVMDRTGNSIELPVEFVDKSHCLRRNHKRMKLANKTLICY